ncbi:hypothetical protein LTR35_011259 [Friedmanniomyces endolithicus]|uniref:Uncharacterized protein n=1 Tax=Friedmanniomyces endolithicus TaxID=329885 RepID=A0AAN6J8C0_9PEZI|nr:hypothetical protein LTS00_016851 [Friedmanniomyces endolithicus]KAK0275211.1 hypothetical protein LTR35_011259 [Friedmanniomyces endolithicus]KAK0320150.1 hypothetical protein LTR82_008667 [Friedmanniomyces endolithicus]KAK0974840.1 hypothetical protein LTR54_016978 [Friedmanniomyces endolithicus]
MATSIGRRQTLRDHLDRIDTLDDDEALLERYQLLDELHEDQHQAENFRYHASKTQNRQDFHLEMYTTFIFKWILGCRDSDLDEMSDDDKKLLLFPDNEKLLASRLNLFMIHVFKRAIPRAKAVNTINAASLVKYRDSMLFWTGWYYEKRSKQWPRGMVYSAMTRAIRYVDKTYGIKKQRVGKTWLGLPELRQLLDHEAFNNRCIKLSEQHQTVWCIARVTALRPGSVCPSGKHGRVDPLTWGDFEFHRGAQPGMFDVRLTVDRLDIKHPQDPTNAAAATYDRIAIRMPSPEPGNLIFSPAHRLLVIALRRGLLKDIHTIDELLDFPGHVISIDVAHLHDIVFYGSKQKGEALDYSKPLMTQGLNDYLQRRGKAVGYTTGITWYSIRRRAATDMVHRIGMASTRIFLGHSPDSQLLERHYLNLTETLDQMGVLLEQPIAADEGRLDWAPLALNKLTNANLQRTRGQALVQMTRRLILADPNPPKDTSPRSLKNYRRNARRIAEQQLFSLEAEKQRTTFSRADMDARLAGLRASNFADEVLRRAVEVVEADGIGNGGSGRLENEAADAEDPEGRLFVGGDQTGEDDSPAEPEEDLERAIARLGNDLPRDRDGAIIAAIEDDNREMDVEDATSDPVKDTSYRDLAKSMMELLLDNTLSTWAQTDRRCPMCLEDDTVGEAQRTHLRSHFHHPVSKWKRKVVLEFRRDGYLYCPYCEGAGLGDAKRYKKMRELIRHIMGSGPLTTDAEHDKLKAADGWYDEDFAQADNLPVLAKTMANRMRRGVENLEVEDVEIWTPRQLLQPEPYEHSERIVRGSHPLAPLPTRYTPFITTHPESLQIDLPSVESSIPPHLKDFVGTGYGLTSTNPLPAYMRNEVIITGMPRSQEPQLDEDEDDYDDNNDNEDGDDHNDDVEMMG